MVTRSDVIRWALADRYRKQGAGGEMQEPRQGAGSMRAHRIARTVGLIAMGCLALMVLSAILPSPAHASNQGLTLPCHPRLAAGRPRQPDGHHRQDAPGHRPPGWGAAVGHPQAVRHGGPLCRGLFRPLRQHHHRSPQRHHGRQPAPGHPRQPDGQPGPVRPVPHRQAVLARTEARLFSARRPVGCRHPGFPLECAESLHHAGDLPRRPGRGDRGCRVFRRHPRLLRWSGRAAPVHHRHLDRRRARPQPDHPARWHPLRRHRVRARPVRPLRVQPAGPVQAAPPATPTTRWATRGRC